MVTKTEWEWLNLQDIASACQTLCDAVSKLSSTEIPESKKIWDIFEAQQKCLKTLERRPKL